jgi:hypothetical protein
LVPDFKRIADNREQIAGGEEGRGLNAEFAEATRRERREE